MRLIDADALKQQLVTTAIVNNPDLNIVNEICKWLIHGQRFMMRKRL